MSRTPIPIATTCDACHALTDRATSANGGGTTATAATPLHVCAPTLVAATTLLDATLLRHATTTTTTITTATTAAAAAATTTLVAARALLLPLLPLLPLVSGARPNPVAILDALPAARTQLPGTRPGRSGAARPPPTEPLLSTPSPPSPPATRRTRRGPPATIPRRLRLGGVGVGVGVGGIGESAPKGADDAAHADGVGGLAHARTPARETARPACAQPLRREGAIRDVLHHRCEPRCVGALCDAEPPALLEWRPVGQQAVAGRGSLDVEQLPLHILERRRLCSLRRRLCSLRRLHRLPRRDRSARRGDVDVRQRAGGRLRSP